MRLGRIFFAGSLSLVASACSVEVDDLFQGGQSGGSGGSGVTGVTGVTGLATHASSAQSTNASTGLGLVCGDGVKGGTEACDGFDLGGASCLDAGFASPGTVDCTSACVVDYSACMAVCGNDVAENGEECDGDDLGGATCLDMGYADPAGVICAPTGTPVCGFADYEFCKPTCNNNVVEPGETCDGTNLNGASCADAGYVNPNGAVCGNNCGAVSYAGCQAVCGNGGTEPGEQCDDGNTTSGDGCSGTCQTESPTCNNVTAVNVGPGQTTLNGATSGTGILMPTIAQSCVVQSGTGPERIYSITTSQAGFFTAYLPNSGTNFDAVLYAESTCGNAMTQISCADNFGTGGPAGEVMSFRVAANQTFFLVVDGYNGNSGTYELRLDLSGGDNCLDPVPITVEGSADIFLQGSTTGLFGDTQANGCGGAGLGADALYQVTFAQNGNYTFDNTSGGYNSVMHARSDCFLGLTEVDCDSPGNTVNSSIQFSANAMDTRFVYVDGTMGMAGDYVVNVGH